MVMGIKKRNSRNYGHQIGLKTVEKIINFAIKKKIKFIILFVFSTENWKRPIKEIKFLFNLLEKYIDNEINNLVNKNIKIKTIGNLKNFPNSLRSKLYKVEKLSKKNNSIQINMALNYGSREEIVSTVKKLKRKNLNITVNNINKNLYTRDIPEPEILIRTGNTNRISNFLIWQSIYTEIFFLKKLWPDFTENDFQKNIIKFQKIKRNFGGLNDRID